LTRSPSSIEVARRPEVPPPSRRTDLLFEGRIGNAESAANLLALPTVAAVVAAEGHAILYLVPSHMTIKEQYVDASVVRIVKAKLGVRFRV